MVKSALTLLLLLGLTTASLAAPPTLNATLTDPQGYINAAEASEIDVAIRALKTKTGVQMGVLVIPTTNGIPIDSYAHTAFQVWKGGSATRNDGVLFILAIDDRRNRIEVGYGLENLLSDAEASAILQALRPNLRSNAYGQATLLAIGAVSAEVQGLKPEFPNGAPVVAELSLVQRNWAAAFVMFLAMLAGALFHFRDDAHTKKRRVALGRKKLAPAEGFWDAIKTSPKAKWETLVTWLVLPVIFGLLCLGSGRGFWWGYPLTWLISAALGARLMAFGLTRHNVMPTLLSVGVVMALIGFANSPSYLKVGSEPMAMAGMLLIGFGILSVLFDGTIKTNGGARSSSSTYRHNSYGSSSSYGGSSSSSSGGGGGWSGGGGSSGGGGASSGW